MSITAKPSPDLLSMPNEILARICAYASDDDDNAYEERRGRAWLRAVRLTCKQLYSSATTKFADNFLTTIYVMGARGSLETLVKICEHPLIGPRIMQISLYGCRLDRDLLSSLRRALDSSLRGGGLRDIREARSRLQSFLDFLEEEVELEQSTGIFFLLVKAFKAIRGYGHSVTLSVFNDPETCPQMLGYQEAVEQISEDNEVPIEDLLTRDGVRSSFKLLLFAAARSKCRVSGLSLNVHRAWCETIFSHRSMDNDFCFSRREVFLQVEELGFTMTEDLFTNDFDNLMRSFLSLTKNLEYLYLCSDSDLEKRAKSFPRAIELLQSDRLRHAEVHGAVCSQDALVSFLDRHKGTLRRFELSGFTLKGSWEEVTLWIRDSCSLTCLRMRWLDEQDENGNEVSWVDSNDFPNNLSRLDEFLEQRRKKQAEAEEEG